MTSVSKLVPETDPWSKFLRGVGGSRVDGVFVDFGDPAGERAATAKGSVYSSCCALCWIEVGGSDAEAFLHGQFSNDVAKLEPNHWLPNAYCNPKGRVLALPGLVRCPGGFRMAVHQSLVDSLLRRLRMYVLRADVVFTPLTGIVNIGLSGLDALGIVQDRWPGVADEEFAAMWSAELLIRRIPGERVMLSTTQDTARELWQSLSEVLRPVGEACWAWLDIDNGWPQIDASLSERFLPQALNLDQLGAVSFDKGCYPGQEVVARVHYLGRVKQRMKRGRIGIDSDVHPGAAVYAGDNRAGDIVDARLGPDGLLDALAVVPAVYDGELRVGAVDGPKLVLV